MTGSSRGLGAAIARRLASDGLAVAVNGWGDGDATGLVAQSIQVAGHRAAPFPADVTDEAQVSDLVSAVERQLGPIDVLVLNATGPQPEGLLASVGWPDHVAQLDFFVRSPLLLLAAVLPGMRRRGAGRIIHIDSEVAHRPPPGRSAYVTAKHAQIGLTTSWALELAPEGITVNSVAPGFVPVERHADVPKHDLDAYVASVPIGRFGTPAEVAHAVSFFASPLAGFVTGQRLVVDGGRRLR